MTTYRFLLSDQVGSSVAVVELTGALVARRLFDPFGEQLAKVGPTPPEPTVQQFGGQRYLEDVELYDFQARWYDADTGRFLQPDPLIESLANPQALNAYSYVRNNPTTLIDPDGMLGINPTPIPPRPTWDPFANGGEGGFREGPPTIGWEFNTSGLGVPGPAPTDVATRLDAPAAAGAPSQGGEARYTSLPLEGPNGIWFPNPEAQQAFGEGIALGASGAVGRGLGALLRGAVLWRAGFTLRGLPLIVDESVSVAGGPNAAALALRQAGYNARSIFEIFGRGGISDPRIAALGARVVTYDKGAQVGQGFGHLAIRPKVQLRDPSELVRFVGGALGP